MSSQGCLGCGSHRFSGGICLECERPQELSPPPPRRQTPASTKASAEHAKRLLAALDAPGPVRRPKRNPAKNTELAAAHAKSIRAAMGSDALAFARAEQTASPGAFWDEVVRVLDR